MIVLSILAGLVGVVGTRVLAARLARAERNREVYWGLGLVALLPAWLIPFVGLLGDSVGRAKPSALWILSSSVALLGVIVTDRVVQRIPESRDDLWRTCWLAGILALVPAWAIALAGGVLDR